MSSANHASPQTETLSEQRPKFRVAICGGGIAGLTLGVALSKYPNIEIAVYEAASSFKEVGAGVMLWGRTWRVLSLLGLHSQLRELAGVPTDGSGDHLFSYDYRRSDEGPEGHRIHLLELPYKSHLYHRAHFLDILVDRLPKYAANLGKRLQSYSQKGEKGAIELRFTDGTKASCDILVGCDGIKSVVRRTMFQKMAEKGQPDMLKYIEPVWTGEITYRALIPAERLPERGGGKHPALQNAIIYCGANKHFVCYPIAAGKIANIAGIVAEPEAEGTIWSGPWVTESTTEEFAEKFVNWESQVQDIVKHAEKPSKWALHRLEPLPAYVDGQVAVLGDAAHAMPPHQASGAGQAIEDAYILAGILGDSSVTLDNLPRALKAYEHVRLPFANHVIESSSDTGKIYQLRSAYGDDEPKVASAIQKQWDWVDSEDPQAQLERALKWMTEPEDSSEGARL